MILLSSGKLGSRKVALDSSPLPGVHTEVQHFAVGMVQATAESEEVAQTGDAEAAAVANESTQGDGAEMAINHKQHQRVLRKNADIPERVSVLRGTSSSQV